MFRKFLVTVVLLVSIYLPLMAMEPIDSVRTAKFTLMISPQHLLINGLRLEAQKIPQNGSRHSFIFSPRFFAGKTRTVDFFTGRREEAEDHAKVLGYGAELQHRLYLSEIRDINKEWVYVAYGFNYHYFSVNFEKEALVPIIDNDGLTYYKYQSKPFKENINRWGAVAVFGAQNPIVPNRRALWDVYLGLGYSYSQITSDYSFIRYNVNLMDFGNTNLYFLAGIKFGLFF